MVVHAKRKAIRFPANWTAELRQRPFIESPVDKAASRKPATRLPPAWATLIRASTYQPIVVEPRVVLPETAKVIDVNTKRIVEAILFAANKPMTIKQIQETFPELEQPDTLDIQMALEDIARDYATRPIGLKHLASGYRFQVREGLAPWVTRLFEEKPARYSRALLETLAIIAYRQPVTRGEIEDIRGVSVSTSIIQTMLEREWIRVIGHKDVPGRPALYGTTKQFLDYFNLTSLNELPTLQAIQDADLGDLPLQQESRERPQTDSEQKQTSTQSESQTPDAEETQADAGGSTESRTLH